MHPYVYKKHHKPHQLIALVLLYYIMILCQPVSSSTCNFPVKKIKIFSEGTGGYVRIRNNEVTAPRPSKVMCNSCVEEDFLYKVTIDKHYMLLYHAESKKFICWDRRFRNLVSRRNPANLTYCKFEDKPSKDSKDHSGYSVRFTSTDDKGREHEIRFHRLGAFARPNLIKKCVKNKNLTEKIKPPQKVTLFLNLDPSKLKEHTKEMEAYRLLTKYKCANPNFLTRDADSTKCVSSLPYFCGEMKMLIDAGHSITPEIMDLCKKEFNRYNY